jgi:hypothetical protein
LQVLVLIFISLECPSYVTPPDGPSDHRLDLLDVKVLGPLRRTDGLLDPFQPDDSPEQLYPCLHPDELFSQLVPLLVRDRLALPELSVFICKCHLGVLAAKGQGLDVP